MSYTLRLDLTFLYPQATGRRGGAALRLYEPQSRQWTLNVFNVADGRLTTPMAGEFQNAAAASTARTRSTDAPSSGAS